MDWRSHALIGFALALAVFTWLGPQPLLTSVGLALLAGVSALLPDLDHDMSKGRQWLNKLVPMAALIGASASVCSTWACIGNTDNVVRIFLIALAITGVYAVVFAFLKPRHRGITHTVIAAVIYGAALYALAGTTMALAGFIGYGSHLLADRHVKLL